MNILIKLMSIVSLVLAPTLAEMYGTKNFESKAANSNIERSISNSTLNTTSGKTVFIK